MNTLVLSLAAQVAMVACESLAAVAPARSQFDPYHITAYEKAACATDAARLCADSYPDEQQLLGCMKTNRASLGHICKVAFNAGLKTRHIQ